MMELVVVQIKSLGDKETLQDRLVLVKDKVYGVGKNGKPFLSLLVGDRTGHIDARIWDNVDQISGLFDIGDVIRVKGTVQVYNNKKQLVIHRLDKEEQSQYTKADFHIEERKLDVLGLFSDLNQIINTIESSAIKQLCLDCLQDEGVKGLLLKSPAAKSIHHAHRGGLLEHIVAICRLMESVAKCYPYLNRDLLLFGALFHDLGKIWELEIQPNGMTAYTHKGQLLGHMLLSCELIESKVQKILGFPEDLKTILKHIILSHHGRHEYGSPKVPMLAEAFVVAAIDDFDSKMNQIGQFFETERQGPDSWSRYNEQFERYFYTENLKGKWL
jgi:3'-5' exoribonuclease